MADSQSRTRADVGWILGVTVAVLVTGLAYSLWWAQVVRHQGGYWIIPDDIWYTVRTAHWIGWGDLSFVYSNPRSQLVTLPGFEVLLTPLVILSSALHLSEVAPGLIGPSKPTEWLVVGSFSMLCASLPIAALDTLARRFGVARLRRRALVVAEGAALWPAVVIWAHPEDALALGFALYALLMVLDRRWAPAGWLLGAAVAMQLLVLMLVPLVVGLAGRKAAGAVLTRAAILPGFLLVAVLVPDFHDSWWVLSHQPTAPSVNHATPWIALAPHLPHGLASGGPGRLLNGVVALGAGVLAWRWRDDLGRVLWLVAAVLAARTVFEAVMVPYYVMPGVAVALVVAGRASWWRAVGVVASAAALTIVTFTHHGRWEYWLTMTGLTTAVLGLAWPFGSSSSTAASSLDTDHRPSLETGQAAREPARTALLGQS